MALTLPQWSSPGGGVVGLIIRQGQWLASSFFKALSRTRQAKFHFKPRHMPSTLDLLMWLLSHRSEGMDWLVAWLLAITQMWGRAPGNWGRCWTVLCLASWQHGTLELCTACATCLVAGQGATQGHQNHCTSPMKQPSNPGSGGSPSKCSTNPTHLCATSRCSYSSLSLSWTCLNRTSTPTTYSP